MFNFVQDQGKRSRHGGINHPAEIQRDRHPYIEYFEDYNLSLSKLSVDPAHRGRRYWTKGDVLKLAHLSEIKHKRGKPKLLKA